jgi:5'-deoxynucleotidase YfbR-like HD superfamily hydrolase
MRGVKAPHDNSGSGIIRTHSGRLVRPLDLKLEDIDINDIAHSLSMQCRFAGHTEGFASVAQHSVQVARHVFAQSHSDPALGLWGLLHDSAEAYLSDVPQPLKHLHGFGEAFIEAEDRIMLLVVEKFGLKPKNEPDLVRYWDKVMVCAELRDFMNSPTPMQYAVEELKESLVSWRPRIAKAKFLTTFRAYNALMEEA